MRYFIAVISCILLVACSSGGGGSDIDTGNLGQGGQSAGPSNPSALPLTGQASYAGFLTLNLPDGTAPGSPRATFTGRLGLAANFAASSAQISGVADDFQTPGNQPMQGRLFVTDGTIERDANALTDYTFAAGISGTLTGASFRNSVITGKVEGDFQGANQSGVTGVVYGDVTTVLGVDVFDGAFAVSKD